MCDLAACKTLAISQTCVQARSDPRNPFERARTAWHLCSSYETEPSIDFNSPSPVLPVSRLLSQSTAAANTASAGIRMSQHQRRAIVAAGAAASILLYFYKRRQPPEGALLVEAVLDENECQTLETLLRDLLKNASSLPGKTYSPVTHPNFVKRNQSRETLQYGAYVAKNRVQNASVAPLPPPLLRVARRLKKLGIVQKTPDA